MTCPACDDDGKEKVDTGCLLREATAEIGSGTEQFEPLSEGAELAFYLGPQGGYHVFGSLRAQGIEPGAPSDPFGPDSPVVTLALSVDGASVGALAEQPRLFSGDTDSAELLGQRVVLEVLNPVDLDGVSALLSGSLVDRCGSAASDAREVVLVLAGE